MKLTKEAREAKYQKLLKFVQEKGEVSAKDAGVFMGMHRSNASKHLEVLVEKGLVVIRKDHQRYYYSIRYEHVSQPIEFDDVMRMMG